MNESFEIDGIRFILDIRPGKERGKSKGDEFILVKTRSFIGFYESLRAAHPKRIVEIGMFQGGSLVLFDKLYNPNRIVGIDIRKEPIAALEEYRQRRPNLITHYGISQDDPSLPKMLAEDLGGEADLIVDDASHLYEPTRDAFVNCFNILRPGGLYVIEDWAWSHRLPYQGADAPWRDKPAMTNLIFELVVETAVSASIKSVQIFPNWVIVEKAKNILFGFKGKDHLRGRMLSRI